MKSLFTRILLLYIALLPLHAEAAISFRAAAEASVASSANPITVNVPAGTSAGDVMIASIAVRPSTITITAPAGWNLIRLVTQNTGNTSDLATYYRVVTGAEPASYTWTFSAAHTGAVGGILSFIGVDNTSPIDDEAGQATGNNNTHTAPNVTTSAADGMLITSHELSSAVTWTPPGGMTEAVDIASQAPQNAAGISLEINYEARAGAGATGTNTATAASNDDTGATQSVALLEAPTRYAVANGNWNATATWSATNCAGAAGASVPTAVNHVVICNNRTVTITAAAAAASVTLNTGGSDVNLNHNAGVSLTVGGGGVTLNGNNTGNQTKAWNINAGSATVNGPVNMNGGSNNNRVVEINLSTGTLDINGDLTMTAGNDVRAVIQATGAADIFLSGDFTFNNGTLAPGPSSTFTYDTAGGFALAHSTTIQYRNLVVNKPGGTSTQNGSTLTVLGNLDIQAGTVNIGTSTIAVGGTTTIDGMLGFTSNTGAAVFTDDVTINAGGTWNNSGNEAITMGGSLTNDGAFTSGTGTYTFQTTAGAVWAGSSGLNFAGPVTVNANRTNNTTTSITGNLTGTATLTNGAGQTLSIGGASTITGLTASALNNTVEYNGAAQTVKVPTGNDYYHLTLSGSNDKDPADAATYDVLGNFTINSGVTWRGTQPTTDPDMNIDGILLNGGTLTTGDGSYTLGGDFTNNGTFTHGAGTFTFNGGAAQNLTGTAGVTTFTNMTLNNANGLNLSGTHDATVGTTLTLTDGRIATGSNLLTANGAVSRCGSTTNCFIVGNLVKPITAGTPTVVWEVGTETASPAYTPVSIAFNGAGAGTFQVTTPTAGGDHADTLSNVNGIDALNSVNQYWTLTAGTATFTSYAPTFSYANIDGGATPATFVIAQRSSGEWSYPVLGGAPTPTAATAIDVLTSAGDVFAIGNTILHLSPYSEWRMDQFSWNGTANEVADNGSGGHSGTAAGLVAAGTEPTTSVTSPAIGGSPGTCHYGVFNRADKHYIALPAGYPNLNAGPGPSAFTITAWIRSTNVGLAGQRIMNDDQSNANGQWGFSLGDPGSGRLRFYYRQAATFILDTPAVITDNAWFFVAAAVRVKSGADASRTSIYVYNTAGALVASVTDDFTATSFGADATPPSLGGETNASGEGTNSFGFAGNLDEIRVYNTAYTAPHVNLIRQITRPCILMDHIRLVHDGEGLTCTPESVIVEACSDAACSSFYTGNVTTTLSPTGWTTGDTITFSGGSTTMELRHTAVETITLGAGSISPVPANATACLNTSDSSASCDLDFVDSGFIFSNVTDVTACKPSANFTIAAVKKSDSGIGCAPAFASGDRAINFWSDYVTPNSGSESVVVNTASIDTDDNPGTDVTLNFDANAEATFTVTYPDAGRMQLNARYSGSGDEAGLEMDGNAMFVSVPVGIAVYPDTGTCNGTTAASPTICAPAGATFDLNVKAACWTDNADTDFADNPATPNFLLNDVAVTHNLVAPSPGTAGTIGTGLFSFVAADNGVHTISQTVSEVGVFTFTATPPAYLGHTIAVATSPSLGRFRPAQYEIVDSSIVPACVTGTPNFTYARQPFIGSITIEAQNTAGNITSNYRDAFVTLDPTTELVFINNQTGVGYDSTAVGVVQSFSDAPTGSAIFGLAFRWDMPQQAPVDSIVQLTGSTDEVATIVGGTVDIGTTNMRYGRIFLEHAFGSERLPLTIPLRAEYATNATQFSLNTADNCTAYDAATIGLTEPNPPAFNVVAPTGADSLNLGVHDIPMRFNTPPNTSGSIRMTLPVPDYLKFDWDNDGNHDNDPTSRATFGIFGGPEDNQIYIREVY